MTLSYEQIFSNYRGIVNDPKELLLDRNDLLEIYMERLHMTASDPRVIAKFTTLTMDDNIQQIEFELKYHVNDFADNAFVIKLFSLGMSIEWLKPQVDSLTHTAEILGGKEEKLLRNNYKPMKERLEKLEQQFSKLICNYGYINNSYLRGDS